MTDEAIPTNEEVAGAATLSEEEHGLAKLLLSESREELTRADGKASLLLAAFAIGLSAILGAILSGDWTPFLLASPWEAIWWIGTGCSGVALLSLGVAVWPRVTHKSGPSGVTYFGEAAAFETVGDLTKALKRLNTDPVSRTVLQLHVISRRADQKYSAIRYGLGALGLFVFLTLAAVLGDHVS